MAAPVAAPNAPPTMAPLRPPISLPTSAPRPPPTAPPTAASTLWLPASVGAAAAKHPTNTSDRDIRMFRKTSAMGPHLGRMESCCWREPEDHESAIRRPCLTAPAQWWTSTDPSPAPQLRHLHLELNQRIRETGPRSRRSVRLPSDLTNGPSATPCQAVHSSPQITEAGRLLSRAPAAGPSVAAALGGVLLPRSGRPAAVMTRTPFRRSNGLP